MSGELAVLAPAGLGVVDRLPQTGVGSAAAVDGPQFAVQFRQRRVGLARVAGELLVLAPALGLFEDGPPHAGVFGALLPDRDEHARCDPRRDELAAVAGGHGLDPLGLELAVRLHDQIERRLEDLAGHITDRLTDVRRHVGSLGIEMDLKAPPLLLRPDVVPAGSQFLAGASGALQILRLGGAVVAAQRRRPAGFPYRYCFISGHAHSCHSYGGSTKAPEGAAAATACEGREAYLITLHSDTKSSRSDT